MSISFTSPSVLRLRATQFDGDPESSAVWRVSVADRPLPRIKPFTFAATGNLLVDGPDGWGDLDVGCLLTSDSESISDDEILGSEAIETFYSFARSHLGPILATVGSVEPIPGIAPDPDLSRYEVPLYDDDEADED